MAPPFVDTHAHLQEPEFADDAAGVIERARRAGVEAIIVPGVDAATSEAASWLADRHADVYFAAGFHPHEASKLNPRALVAVRKLLSHPRAVAVGEIGLDYYRMHSPRAAQLSAFETMLDLAQEAALPAIVHCREAADDVSRILRSWALRHRPAYQDRPLGVLHYFSGTPDEARSYVESGFLISIHTSVTHSKAFLLRQVVGELPLEALVIETDAPYGAPQSQRGKRNEPAFVTEGAAKIAEIQGLTLEEVARATSANAERLFGIHLSRKTGLIGAPV